MCGREVRGRGCCTCGALGGALFSIPLALAQGWTHFEQREPEDAMILSGGFAEDIARGQCDPGLGSVSGGLRTESVQNLEKLG